jgi:hypothetical protein
MLESAEGAEMDASDLIHFRACSDCQRLLKALTRHANSHLPIRQLWECARDETQLKDKDNQHLMQCEHCTAILGIGRTAKSPEQVVEILKEHGFNIDE